MNLLFNRIRTEVALYGVLLVSGLAIQFSFSQAEITLFVNGHWSAAGDFLLKYYTHLGDGLFAVAVGLLLLIKDRKLGMAVLISYAGSALLAQALKHLVFADVYRPSWVLKGYPFHYVEGVELFAFNSFPSGHSTTAFALATMLSFMTPHTYYKAGLFLMAVLVCYSRIYLLQHFFQDTLAGSLIGFFVSLIVFRVLFVRKDGEPL